MELNEKQENERLKYEALLSTDYGSMNHGRFTYDLVSSYEPCFVIDFGCGRNNYINHLKTLNIKGIGIDFVFPEANILCPMHKVPIEDNIADVIVAFDSLEHLLTEDVDSVFKEMQRVAKNNAYFIFSICTRKSIKTSLGQNLHPTVKPISWWIEKISQYAHVDKERYKLMYLTGRFFKNN